MVWKSFHLRPAVSSFAKGLARNDNLIYIRTLASSARNEMTPSLLVTSIGNPEPRYSNTRHNVGHWIIDQIVRSYPDMFRESGINYNGGLGVFWESTSNSPNITLFKSTNSYMNLQGSPVSKVWNQYRKSEQSHGNVPFLVVIHDELQMPLGKIQLRKQGTSARGHNGLRSIDLAIGKTYTKISIGIGKPVGQDVAEYVLSPFEKNEKDILITESFPKAYSCITQLIKETR